MAPLNTGRDIGNALVVAGATASRAVLFTGAMVVLTLIGRTRLKDLLGSYS